MPGLLVTTNASIKCTHGGSVTIVPRPGKAIAGGGTVLCEPDLVGATIVGCTQPASQSSKPCTSIVSMQPGSTSLKVKVVGRPAYVASLVGVTDGVPPATVAVLNPGQKTVVG